MHNTLIGFIGVVSHPADVRKYNIDMDKHGSSLVIEVINVINQSRLNYWFPVNYSSLLLKYPTFSDNKGQGFNLKLRHFTRLIPIYF